MKSQHLSLQHVSQTPPTSATTGEAELRVDQVGSCLDGNQGDQQSEDRLGTAIS